MSKRSRRKTRRKRLQKKSSVPALMQQGKTAFKQEDYPRAIKALEQAYRRPNAPAAARAALAEAYFRRALNSLGDPVAKIDLKHAVQLSPKNPLYRYHLALAQHRDGNPAQAIPVYRELLAASSPFLRAAFPLAQALVQQKKALGRDPVWKLLNNTEKTLLFAAEALVKNKADSTLQKQLEKPLPPLWRGLIAFKLKNYGQAKEYLRQCANNANCPPSARGVALNYLGALDAMEKRPQSALQRWQTAKSYGAVSAQFESARILLVYSEMAQLLRQGRPQKAAKLLETYAGEDAPENSPLMQRLDMELAYRDAQKGNWEQALSRWEKAREEGDNSRSLLFNLALAYQHTHRHSKAAETWRSVLRRRPRKADHPEALNDDQVARLWQRVAENYTQAGDYEEAIKTYKTAVKKSPKNVSLRLKLVEAYQEEGRWQAAENELVRILDHDPNYIPALTQLAEIQNNTWNPEPARNTWRRILQLEPKNPVARQQLAHSYAEEADQALQWGGLWNNKGPEAAARICKAGLQEFPDDKELLFLLGKSHLLQNKFEQAVNYLEQAVGQPPYDLNVLYDIYLLWLNYNRADMRQAILERLKALSPPPPGALFISLFKACRERELLTEAESHLEHIITAYPNDDDLLADVAYNYSLLDKNTKTLKILKDILQRNPTHIDANLNLGMYYYEQGHINLTRRYLNKAEAQARKENDVMALYEIKAIKDEALYGKKISANPFDMLFSMPSELRDSIFGKIPKEALDLLKNNPNILREMFEDLDDDYDDDDDDYDYYI